MFQRKSGRAEKKEQSNRRLDRDSDILTLLKPRGGIKKGMRLIRACRLGCVSALLSGLGRSVSFLVPSPLRKHMSRQSTKTSSDGLTDPLENELDERPRDVAFLSPLLKYGYLPAVEEYNNGTLTEKPLLLYLPGFDGTYLSPFLQFPELGTVFDVRCMTVSMNDRSSFLDLRSSVLEYLLSELALNQLIHQPSETTSDVDSVSTSKGTFLSHIFTKSSRLDGAASDAAAQISKRPVYLAGESFGGVLAADVALSLLEDYRYVNLKGLALVNAATCYDRSRLAATGPSVADYHPALYPIGLLQLLPLFTDEHSWKQLLLILQAKALPSVIDNDAREAYLGRFALSLPFVLPVMTQDAMKWRLVEWLDVGCSHMSRRLRDFGRHSEFRVLIVAGEQDAALPSIAEAERLASILPNALVHVVEGAGHASTCGSRVDLAALFRQSYPELRTRKIQGSHRWQSKKVHGRTDMKPIAAAGKGEFFGMEPRYDNATIGLNPLTYWSSKYYRRCKQLPKAPALVHSAITRSANETLLIH